MQTKVSLNNVKSLTIETMKKVILVFVFALGFGIVASNAAIDNKDEKKKEVKKEAAAPCATKAATTEKSATTGCAEAQKKSCATAGKSCCGTAKAAEKK
jgi:hypothetical protein